ncbi:hypothetical protein J21TS3_22780 [Paenibacillus cookii]|uniref:Uncharacterized protein n=1 Tax=Paenibacillus cookii TaxID=157839 RepID=A0ABQ4LW47_9BACL|nr:hypothetical protein J21TS3_22780 [Paenibacillus cookii]
MTLIIDVKVSFALTSVPVAPHLEQKHVGFSGCARISVERNKNLLHIWRDDDGCLDTGLS